ncbi:MAG: hypothetical protein NC824_00895, partial [Candidatus Omnitrophica bacterium]|nr:hypothetical protein [Candidatus Omnitrophota bacterium]
MEFKENFEELLPYYEAFWNCEVLDRIAAIVIAPKDRTSNENNWKTPRFVAMERSETVIDSFERYVKNLYFGGLAVPIFWPNFGPDVFSAFLGADMHYSEDSSETSWIDWKSPVITDYNTLENLFISDENFFYRKNIELLKLAAERSKGRYIVGATDLHAGFDALCV